MKLVTNGFEDISAKAGIGGAVANAACLFDDRLYLGTDDGLQIVIADGNVQKDALTAYLSGQRIRWIEADGDGITVPRSRLAPLSYTDLPYGDYTLHIEVLDHGSVLRDDTYRITKAARLGELRIIRIMAGLLVAAAALLKLNDESTPGNDDAEDRLVMERRPDLLGWDVWKKNKAGVERSVRLVRRGRRTVVTTEDLGLFIEQTTVLRADAETVYAALTGDQVALTDIRVH